mgnify:CR=1 FL=1
MGSTGCSLLDSKGVGKSDTGVKLNEDAMITVSNEEVIKYCAHCNRCNCRLDDLQGREFKYKTAVYYKSVDYTYQCIKCGVMETLSFVNGKMDNTRKFIQVGDVIYHTTSCGTCRKVGSST